MIEPVDAWLHVRPISNEEDSVFDTSSIGIVEVLRDNAIASERLGIKIVKGMFLIVEPSLIMQVGEESFLRATEQSVYAIKTD